MATEPTKQLLQAIAVTAELLGTELSEVAARVFAQDLARFPEAQVLGSLQRCRREVRGRLSIADVISRLDDGRPGPEEAWAAIPHDEYGSCVMTEEMSQAYGIAAPLLNGGDEVGARMAFRESYTRLLQKARDESTPVRWFPSLGFDGSGRVSVIAEAVRLGRLSLEHSQSLLPHEQHEQVLGILGTKRPQLTSDQQRTAENVRALIRGVTDQMTGAGRDRDKGVA